MKDEEKQDRGPSKGKCSGLSAKCVRAVRGAAEKQGKG
jgi:hypothetical protein